MNGDIMEAIDKRLDRISLVLTLIAFPMALTLRSPKAAVSIALGALLSYVNFHWLRQAVDFVVIKGVEGRVGGRIALRYAARYALIGLVLYATIRSSLLDLFFVFAGLFVYVAAILIECFAEVGRVLIRDYRNWKNIN